MDLRLFYFHVKICPRRSIIKRVTSDTYTDHIYIKHLVWKPGKRKKRSKISAYSPYYIGNTFHRNCVFVCNNTDHCKVDQGVHME